MQRLLIGTCCNRSTGFDLRGLVLPTEVGALPGNQPAFLPRCCCCINIFANGQLATKAELVNACNSGQMKYDTFDLKKDDRKVRVYGNTAVLTSEAEVKRHQGSTVVSGTYRRSLVFVKMKNGQWQLVTAQATKEQ
jgi:Domain of unknown function (DUF4440)